MLKLSIKITNNMKKLILTLSILFISSCVPPLGKDMYCDKSFLKSNSNSETRNQNKIINTTPEEIIHILSIEKEKEKLVAYSIPNQKHKGDFVLGVLDKKTGTYYINLGNNAVSMFPLIRVESYLRLISEGNESNYAKSISQGSVKNWHKYSYINGNKNRGSDCFITQEKWNKKYNTKTNKLLSIGTKKFNKLNSINQVIVTRNDLGGF